MTCESFSLTKKVALRDKKHIAFIRTLPCVRCGVRGCDAAHISFAGGKGMGRKVDDCYVVPLCRRCHTYQHSIPERQFWTEFGFPDPTELALLLYKHTHNRYICCVIIRAVQMMAEGQMEKVPLEGVVKDDR